MLHKLTQFRTLLLGLAVLTITFMLFIALPAVLPSVGSTDFDKLMWACRPSIMWDTWMWISPEQPDVDTWLKSLAYIYPENDIRYNLHRTGLTKGLGALQVQIYPENSDQIIVSGYLQYGKFLKKTDNVTGLIPMHAENYTSPYEEYRDYTLAPGLANFITDNFPPPVLQGMLARRVVHVSLVNTYGIGQSSENYTVVTDENGYFSLLLKPDPNAAYYNIVPVYFAQTIRPQGTGNPGPYVYPTGRSLPEIPTDYLKNQPSQFFFGTTCTYTSLIPKLGGPALPGFPWWWLVLGTVIAGGVFYYFRYYRKRVKYRPVPGVQEPETVIGTRVRKEKRAVAPEELFPEIIVFPDIAASLPAVWGVSEPLEIVLRPREALSGMKNWDITFGDGESALGKTGGITEVNEVHIFKTKGEYAIQARYREGGSQKDTTSSRNIRIVDYREEMVRLFSEMLEKFNLTDIAITPDMTPRDVERLLTSKLETVNRDSIRRIVGGFEEANYSTHPVNRERYLRMYGAILDVIE